MAKQTDEMNTKPQGRSKKNVKSKSSKSAGWITFFKEVNVEMRKVTWPSRKEIIGSTTALIVATMLVSMFLGLVDLVLAKGVQPALAGHADYWSYATLIVFAGILGWVYKSN